MSKADELSKKMGQVSPVSFTPRQSVEVKPLSVTSDENEQHKNDEAKPDSIPVVQAEQLDTNPTTVQTTTTSQETGDINSYKNKYLQKEEDKVTKTFRMYRRRSEQLDKEVRESGLEHWQIIDVGLEMYFRNKK